MGKALEGLIQNWQGTIRVHQFGESMPLCKTVQKWLYNFVVVAWKSPSKMGRAHWDRYQSHIYETWPIRQTCSMSSKSRAASLFISLVLLANLCMTPFPYDRTQWNLRWASLVQNPWGEWCATNLLSRVPTRQSLLRITWSRWMRCINRASMYLAHLCAWSWQLACRRHHHLVVRVFLQMSSSQKWGSILIKGIDSKGTHHSWDPWPLSKSCLYLQAINGVSKQIDEFTCTGYPVQTVSLKVS